MREFDSGFVEVWLLLLPSSFSYKCYDLTECSEFSGTRSN